MKGSTFFHCAPLVAIMLATPALAKTTPEAAPQETPDDAAGVGADIVVTAQKRSENLQSVPIVISAFSNDRLETTGVQTTSQLTTLTPGLNVRITNGSFQPTIRGIGTSAGFVENPVSLYVDGVYVPQQREGVRDLNDIAQVAVLKGPQGTLFGRNSTGGVIQITTRTPSHDLYIDAEAGIDNYETLRSALYVTGGLAPTLAASVSLQYTTQGIGWGRNYTTGNDTRRTDHRFNVRGKLLFEPASGTTLTLIGEHFDRRDFGEARTAFPGTQFVYPGFGPVRTQYDTYGDGDGEVAFHGESGSLTIDQDIGFAKLQSISSYRYSNGFTSFDNDAVASPLFFVHIDNQPSRDYTQELQLVSRAGGPFRWVVGAFYLHNFDSLAPSITSVRPPLFPRVAVIQRDSAQTTESIAGFAQVTWEFLPRTKLTGGARYTYERRRFDATQTTTSAAGVVAVPVNGTLSIEKPTFRVALDHEFAPRVLGYVSFNTGFKSGGYNLLAPLAPAYQPETLKAYEAGVKTELFDRNLRFNASAFYYDYTNIQVSQIINNLSTVSNGAKARLYGLDVDVEARLADGLRFSGGIELLHAEFTKYANAQIARVNPAGGGFIGSGDVSGNRIPLSQKVAGNAALDYETALGGSRLHLNVLGNYNGSYFFEPDNLLRQRAYLILNSSAEIKLPGDRVSVMLWGRNLLDKAVIGTTNATATGFATTYNSPPRTYGATVRVRY